MDRTEKILLYSVVAIAGVALMSRYASSGKMIAYTERYCELITALQTDDFEDGNHKADLQNELAQIKEYIESRGRSLPECV